MVNELQNKFDPNEKNNIEEKYQEISKISDLYKAKKDEKNILKSTGKKMFQMTSQFFGGETTVPSEEGQKFFEEGKTLFNKYLKYKHDDKQTTKQNADMLSKASMHFKDSLKNERFKDKIGQENVDKINNFIEALVDSKLAWLGQGVNNQTLSMNQNLPNNNKQNQVKNI
jgi:hypothetical protein